MWVTKLKEVLMSTKFGVIDMETGEIVRVTPKKSTAAEESVTEVTKDMIKNPSEELTKFLYRAMRSSNKIDRYGMIKVDGLYVGEDFFRIGAESGLVASNFFALKGVLSVRGFVKKTCTTDCENWTDVMEVLGIETSNKRKVALMKRLLTSNDVIREARKPHGDKVYVVNPMILRHGSHTSDYCISMFKDKTLTRVDKFNTYLMYINGLLNYSDLN